MNLNLKEEHQNNTAGKWVTISLGAATEIAEPGKSFSDLLVKADKALYEAKGSGRNRTSFFGRG